MRTSKAGKRLIALTLVTVVIGMGACSKSAADGAGGKNDGSGGDATMTGGTCGIHWSPENCGSCIEARCCDASTACANSDGCVDIATKCLPTPTENCGSGSKDAVEKFNALSACMNNKCDEDCLGGAGTGGSGGSTSTTTSTSTSTSTSSSTTTTTTTTTEDHSCVGSPPTCASQPISCTEHKGCRDSDACTGHAHGCALLGEGSCEGQRGCDWDEEEFECSGFAESCDEQDDFSCGEQEGCEWTHSCAGTPTPCSSFGSESTCNTQDGCRWE